MNFKAAVKIKCLEKGMDISTLAEKMGANQRTLYGLINGLPSMRSVKAIADGLGIKPSELIEAAENAAMAEQATED